MFVRTYCNIMKSDYQRINLFEILEVMAGNACKYTYMFAEVLYCTCVKLTSNRFAIFANIYNLV